MSNSRNQDPFLKNFSGSKCEKESPMRDLWRGILLTAWMGGVVLAEGWFKMLAIFIPFYSWYLFVEKIMMCLGLK